MGRSERYAVWRACERFGLLPPRVKRAWDDNDFWVQASLIGFDHIRQQEDVPPPQV